MNHFISSSTRLYLRCLVPMLLLLLAPSTALSQSNDGCPPGEFGLDGCVLCNEGCELQQTGAISPNGLPCFRCDCSQGNPEPLACIEQVFPVAGKLVLNVFAEKGSFPAQLEGIATVRTSARDPETRVIQTEILSMELTGNIKIGHPRRDVPIKLKIGRSFGLPPSTGRIIPITPRAVFPATSFFDVFTQIELEGRVLHNEFPIRMNAIIFNNEVNPPFTAVDVFGTEFELVESAGGAEAAYTGLNYVFQDFWEFLEDDE